MSDKSLIIVKQLPVIEARLKAIEEQVNTALETARSLVVTAESKQIAKQLKAELNKERDELEMLRKQVKNAVLEPYNAFEKMYKDIIKSKYDEAENELKSKISAIEEFEILQKKAEIIGFFDEYIESLNCPFLEEFLHFENSNIKVNLSVSMTALRTKAVGFVDKIYNEYNLIKTLEYGEEILLEYIKDFNLPRASLIVHERHKFVANVANEFIPVNPPEDLQLIDKENEILSPPVMEKPAEDKETLCVSFKVYGTKNQLKDLKQFLIDGGYIYE